MIEIKKDGYSVSFINDGHALSVSGGRFGEMNISPSPLFFARVKRVSDGKSLYISSADAWGSVSATEDTEGFRFKFDDPCEIFGVSVEYKAEICDTGIYWTGSVKNQNSEWSVMEVSYPYVLLCAEKFDFFVPQTSGIVIRDAGEQSYEYTGDPCFSMQYFAAYSNQGGIYIGIHDPYPAMKRYEVSCGQGTADIRVYYVGENGNIPANSFVIAGGCKWQAFTGDWYDAAMIYSDFIKSNATWLPKTDENGRSDTADKFKELPFWVCDYIPNSVSQGENKPMKLSAGSDIYTQGYWYNAVIELQKALDVPIAYHTYNWHEIPFNVDYPHFLPAKDEYRTGLAELKKHDIYVMPYINSLSWETRDNFSGKYNVTFENTGKYGAVKLEDGRVRAIPYPQTHNDGRSVLLAYICSSFRTWHDIIKDTVSEIESTLDVDGVYFDQLSAFHGVPCYDKTHGHSLGGGRYWCDGHREHMRKIIADKPRSSFYFSEDNTEEYINLFDGFLTWRWVMSEAVPAFPAVYAGYVQMIGRNNLGEKKDDTEFFKYSLAKSFLYGQQLGWIKADVIYNEERLNFLKTLVKERYRFKKLFAFPKMLRPPRVSCSLKAKVTTPAMKNETDIVMEQVCAGAWKYRNGDKIVIFVINIAKEESEYYLSFDNGEYGISEDVLHKNGFKIDINGKVSKQGRIAPESIKSFELDV